MNENIIAWNMANWITVSIMVLILFFVLGLAQKAYTERGQNAQVSSS